MFGRVESGLKRRGRVGVYSVGSERKVDLVLIEECEDEDEDEDEDVRMVVDVLEEGVEIEVVSAVVVGVVMVAD